MPALRNKGLGTSIMRALMDEARSAGIPFRLKVASSNDPSLQLYLRLGFVPIADIPAYIELEWPPPTREPPDTRAARSGWLSRGCAALCGGLAAA